MAMSVVLDNRRPSVLRTRFPTDRKHVFGVVETSFDLEEFLLRFKGTIYNL